MKAIILFWFLMVSLLSSAQNIETIFQEIPDSVMHICDWRDSSKYSMASSGIKTIDVKNGFIGFKRTIEEEDFFQAALFNVADGTKIVLIRTQACEYCCCEEPLTFLYHLEDKIWKEDKENRLPVLRLQQFLTDSLSFVWTFEMEAYVSFKLNVPQHGTKVIVKPLVCDYLIEDQFLSKDEYDEVVQKLKARTLLFDRQKGIFYFD